MTDRPLGLALLGTGYLAKAFVLGYRSAPVIFGPDLPPTRPVVVATSTPAGAARDAAALGFARSTADWRAAIADPEVDIVIVNTPNDLHKDQALAAIAAGRHVHCEKPLGRDRHEARAMTLAAEAQGVRTIVGFNYRQNPACALAREIIASGELGEVISFRATHVEDFAARADTSLGWKRTKARAGYGALGDVGSHITCIIEYLLGPIARVCGTVRTVYPDRPLGPGSAERGPVETDDEARFLCELHSGVPGTIEASRVATGRKMGLAYEITGTKGTLAFDQARLSELSLYEASAPPGRRGFKTLLLDPDHPDYAAFNAGPGHGLGFNDQKIVECARFLEAIRDGSRASPDFRCAWRVNAVLDAVLESHRTRTWAEVAL
jgi:predicted dehydrogenase